ncbi:MAG: hypothetical protein R2867_32705 [Caldilineaceae bacterium]
MLWMLGAEAEALQLLAATIAHARDLGHPFTLALVLAYGAMVHQFRDQPEAVEKHTIEALALCRKHGVVY